MSQLSGQVAVVTGAGSGVGAALAEVLAELGVKLALIDVDEAAVNATARKLVDDGSIVIALTGDVASIENMQAIAATVEQHYGSVQLLFNNAGILGSAGMFLEQTPGDWQRCLGVNLMGVVNGMQVFLPGMLASKAPCHIVNLASIAALMRQPRMSPYYASKSAVLAVSEVVALECADSDVEIHVVCPGAIATNIAKHAKALHHSDDADTALQAFDEVLEAGMSPRQVAEKILESMLLGQRYILTHPEHDEQITQRFDEISAGFTG